MSHVKRFEYSCTEAFARVSKKGMHVVLAAPSAPNSPPRAFYETISEGNRTVVSQTDSTSIFPQRLKKRGGEGKAKQDEWFFKRECHSCTSVLQQIKPVGLLRVKE